MPRRCLPFCSVPAVVRGFVAAASLGAASMVPGAPAPKTPKPPKPAYPAPLAEWVEPDFPFFSSILDAGPAPAGSTAKNLTPRALILNLGRECWVAFDTDLL